MAVIDSCVLSIAGFDPCGGAGILADIKTFEALGVLGMGAVSAVTFQNDSCFEGLKWIEEEDICKQLDILKKRFEFPVVKIGLIESLEKLGRIVTHIRKLWPSSRVIWDPIIKASAGFKFHNPFHQDQLFSLLNDLLLITPNTEEAVFLAETSNPMEAAARLSQHCAVLLKGGHNEAEPGTDHLFTTKKIEIIRPAGKEVFPKHGSGCVLSSAVAANLALGNDLITSCQRGKKYTERFLSGNQTLLGKHYAN